MDLSLLAVYAHPDDEAHGSAGTLAKYCREGIAVTLISATRGEAGEISTAVAATERTLGAVREAELRESCRLIGLSDLRFLDCRDGSVRSCPADVAVGGIVLAIRQVRPQVVITFGPEGIYGHPDHVAVHHFTLAACRGAPDPEAFPEQLNDGLRPFAPARVYFRIIPKSRMASVASVFEEIRRNLGLEGEDIESFFTADDEVTVAVDVAEYLDIKKKAICAHRSQVGDDPFAGRTSEEIEAELGTEYYRLLGSAGRASQDGGDLFVGLR